MALYLIVIVSVLLISVSSFSQGVVRCPPSTVTDIVYVKTPSNLRSGPAVWYDVVGTARVGQQITLWARSGNWLKLSNNTWIRSNLVENAPSDLPIIEISNAPTPPTPVPTKRSVALPKPKPYKHCYEFKTRAEYDAYYGAYKPAKHDRDRDGIFCEGLK